MKDDKIQIVGSFIIISILVLMMLDSLFFSLTPKLLNKLHLTNDAINEFFQINNATLETIEVDCTKKYPFKDIETKKENSKNMIQKYLSVIEDVKSKLETYTSKGIYGYEKLVELSFIYNKILSYNIVSNFSNDRVEIKDGYYTELKPKNIENSAVAEKLIKFNDYLNSLNINYLYINVPSKVSRNQKFPSIYKDYTNENEDELLKAIDGKVDYIDLRENMEKLDTEQLKLYYKTDHHWLPETGLWATKEISKYINQNYNYGLQISNIEKEKYNFKTYPKMFLGSDGKYVSLANAEPEDFSLITPKFDTKLDIKIGDSINKTGSFQETVIDWQLIKYANYYRISQYSSYMYGDKPLIELKNENVKNGKKILLIKDSFADVVSPFLVLENEYLSIIDLRYFNGSLNSYIEEYQPDMVLNLYSALTISEYSDKTDRNHYLIDRLNQ